MLKRLSVYLQYILPQHALSKIAGKLSESDNIKLKQLLILNFMRRFNVNLQEAEIEDPQNFKTFNDFFIRKLKTSARNIDSNTHSIISPVDGTLAQFGKASPKKLLQAKNMYYDLDALLGSSELADIFADGEFATLYLAPFNYHRVHMPIAGQLIKSVYIPGKLFSVNRMTSQIVPQLFTRNERFISLFETKIGHMAVCMVGAMIVGSMQMKWMQMPIKHKNKILQTYTPPIFLDKGAELGYFKLGSTVILLFEKNKINWSPSVQLEQAVQFGQVLASFS